MPLPKRQVAAQDGESGVTKSLGQCDQQGSLSIRAGTVRENQAVAARAIRQMQETTHGRI
jgi:hypothetical protein